jgi:hypothetical protein
LKKKLLTVFGIIVAILLGWLAISIACDPEEPSYEGRTLSQWIMTNYATFGPYIEPPNNTQINAQIEASEQAIKAIGTNAIPTALRWLSKNYDARDYFHFSASIKGYPLNGMAETVFEILGEDAQSATPTLIQLARNDKDAKTRIIVMRLLKKLNANKKSLVPVFIECAKEDKDTEVRCYALSVLVEEIGLDSKTGKDLMASLLHDPDEKVRHRAELYNDKADFFFADSPDEKEKAGVVETNNIQTK